MIQVEYLNEGTLVKHYSDTGVFLMQNETGCMYADPIDAVPCQYTYTETDLPIDTIVYEPYDENLVRIYSSRGVYIERDGIRYAEVIESVDSNNIYIETDELIYTETNMPVENI